MSCFCRILPNNRDTSKTRCILLSVDMLRRTFIMKMANSKPAAGITTLLSFNKQFIIEI